MLLASLGEEDMHTFADSANKQKLKGPDIALPYTEYCILIKSEVFFIYNRPEKPTAKYETCAEPDPGERPYSS